MDTQSSQRLRTGHNPTITERLETRIENLQRDKRLAEEKAANYTQNRRGFAEVFELAMTFLANSWKIWENGSFEAKRNVLKLVFPERLAYCRKTGS